MREVDLVSYLPPFLKEYEELDGTLNAENPEFILAWNAAERTLRNEFIDTADEYGISRYEKMLGILPFKEDTLESRRARVHTKWFTYLPYTMQSLISKLIALCGENNFTITEQLSIYQLRIDVNLELLGQVDDVESAIQAMLPCNIVLHLYNNISCTATGSIYTGTGITTVDVISIYEGEDNSKWQNFQS